MPRFLAGCLALLLVACDSGIPPGLLYDVSGDPRPLDPALSTDVPTGESVVLLFDNLTQFGPDGRLVPGLATRWWPSPDGATWTFRLRGGARFHDGGTLFLALPAPTLGMRSVAFLARMTRAIDKRDLPAIQGSILFLSLVFVLANLLTDLLYAKADPRVAYD